MFAYENITLQLKLHLPLSQNHLVAAFFERQFLARGEEIILISRFCNSNGVYTLCGCRRCLVRVYVLYHSSLDVLESENMTIACQPCDSCSPISTLSLFNFKSVCLAALTGVARSSNSQRDAPTALHPLPLWSRRGYSTNGLIPADGCLEHGLRRQSSASFHRIAPCPATTLPCVSCTIHDPWKCVRECIKNMK